MQIRPAKAVVSPTGGSRELLLLLCFGACTYSASRHFGRSLVISFLFLFSVLGY